MLLAALSTVDVIGLLSAAVSTALAVFAIWQSMIYYRWSNEAQRESDRSARAIGASVEKLENLFDRLYSDAFGMLRETHTDMRKHMWEREPRGTLVEEVEERTQANLDALREELRDELRSSVADVRSDRAIDQKLLEGKFQTMIERAIQGSTDAKAEAVESTARDRVLRHLRRRARDGLDPLPAYRVLSWMRKQGFSHSDFREAISSLRDDGYIEWESDGERPRGIPSEGSTVITVTAKGLEE